MVLLLAGCGEEQSLEEPTESPASEESLPPLQGEDPTPPIALDTACDLLIDQSAMPNDDEIEFVNARDSVSEFSTSCYIEPADWSAALEFGYVARDDLTLQFMLEGDLELIEHDAYETGRPAEDYLTDTHSDILPASRDGWPETARLDQHPEGHYHEFVFNAQLPQSTVEHKIQFFVPGSEGDDLEEYRPAAYDVFTAHMDVLAAEL